MNRETRKQLKQLQEKLTSINLEFEQFKENLEEIMGDVESIREEEQDKYDNMPESIQQGEKGDTMQEGIDSLDDLYSQIEDTIISLEDVGSSLYDLESHEAFDL
jgi:uncharacterized coiled-coil DUF342 family protein